MTIPLIQGQDGFEAVRDAVANILATESVNQMVQAEEWNAANPTEPQLNPEDWRIRVFSERSNAVEMYRDADYVDSFIVNVFYDSSNTVLSQSVQGNQVTTSRIMIECLATGVSEETADGHIPGDHIAFTRSHMVARICRRILMRSVYRQLALPSIVRNRNMVNRKAYRPNQQNVPVEHVAGVAMQFDVSHNEGFDFEQLSLAEGALVTIRREPNGQIIAQADYDWTT